ncbi:MAG: hypothetical protein JNJ49_12505 [Bdellovibrionaceae bacterium]|nr:hypothetical protein [Pseudobdellovibrionaceae bacterium]
MTKLLAAIFALNAFLPSYSFARKAKIVENSLNPDYSKTISLQKTTCAVNGKSFEIFLGATTKDDSEELSASGYPFVWLRQGKSKSIGVFPAKEYNELLFMAPKKTSACKATQAFVQPNGIVTLLFRTSGRPFSDYLAMAFYDPAENKILASERRIAKASNVEQQATDYVFQFDDSPSDAVDNIATLRGKRINATEAMFKYFMRASLRDDTIVVTQDPELTWERAGYKAYFKSQTEFEKAFGWNATLRKFDSVWVYSTSNPDCIQARVERSVISGDKNWFCK